MDDSETPVGLRPTHKREIAFKVTARPVEGEVRVAHVTSTHPPGATFTIVSDEGPWSGAGSTAPYPLSYFSASLGF